MAQITSTGVTGKSENEYLVDIQTRMLAIDPNWNIDNDSPDGQKNGIDSEMLANLDEAVVEAYRSKDPDSATGEALNNIGKISGVTRQAATFSVAPVTFSGTNGTIVPAGARVLSRIDSSIWLVNSAITIGSGGTGSGFATSAISGRVLADVGDLTVIGNPQAGITAVTNPGAATPGEPEETDTAFRLRRAASVSLAGSNMLDNMTAAVGNVAGVSDVKIYENINIDPTDANGLPIHSISVVVNGGSDADIGYAMYTKKNPGAGMYPRWNGDTDAWIDTLPNGVKVDVTSPVTGNTAPMTFQRAIALPIYVDVDVQKIGSLPSNIDDLIKQAIVADSNKTLFSGGTSQGFNQNGYDIGEIVPAGRIYTPVNKVLGVYGDSYVTAIRIGTAPDPTGTTTIQPDYNELAVFDPDNIVVAVTS